MNATKIIIGAIVLGILTIILGYLSGYIIHITHKSEIPVECTNWNKNHVMEKSLFITGIMLYFVIYWFFKSY